MYPLFFKNKFSRICDVYDGVRPEGTSPDTVRRWRNERRHTRLVYANCTGGFSAPLRRWRKVWNAVWVSFIVMCRVNKTKETIHFSEYHNIYINIHTYIYISFFFFIFYTIYFLTEIKIRERKVRGGSLKTQIGWRIRKKANQQNLIKTKKRRVRSRRKSTQNDRNDIDDGLSAKSSEFHGAYKREKTIRALILRVRAWDRRDRGTRTDHKRRRDFVTCNDEHDRNESSRQFSFGSSIVRTRLLVSHHGGVRVRFEWSATEKPDATWATHRLFGHDFAGRRLGLESF